MFTEEPAVRTRDISPRMTASGSQTVVNYMIAWLANNGPAITFATEAGAAPYLVTLTNCAESGGNCYRHYEFDHAWLAPMHASLLGMPACLS